jgi:hypothetical protein
VSERFPGDNLALAAVADNAASVAGAEHDYGMLDVAIDTYERLLERTTEQSGVRRFPRRLALSEFGDSERSARAADECGGTNRTVPMEQETLGRVFRI